MRLDRKFFLIAPSLVLVLVAAGLFSTAASLHELVIGSADLTARRAFADSVARGQKTLLPEHALEVIKFSLDAESRRTAAIAAAHDGVVLLAWMVVGCCAVLLWAVRGVPRRGSGRPQP